jgi:uncharacterized protein (DUF4415 family)
MQANDKSTVKRTLDLTQRPVNTDAQKARLGDLVAMPDERINYTDAAFLPGATWVKVSELPEVKQQITLRLDADVLDYFRHTKKRYQTRINAVLRSYVEAHKARAK